MRLTSYRPTAHRTMELSTAGMIDVVFLLLIFFVATTTFLAPERLLNSAIVVEHQSPAEAGMRIEPLMIDLVSQAGQHVFQLGATRSPSLDILIPVIQQYPDKSAGAWIRLSDNVPFSMAAAAVNACSQAGFEAVSMVPLRSGPE